MKSCPQCHGTYAVAEGFCPMDGTRLRNVDGAGGKAAPEDEFAASLVGRVLDRRYRLDEVIGAGGMGVVYRATHVLIGKSLAVKVLRREHNQTPDVGRRFLLEARVASNLKHPNVVDINDFGELPEGGAYYAMEFLAGRTLARRIDDGGPIEPPSAFSIALQVCHGLTAAHGQGVVHRDLKPDNVFLVDPRGSGKEPLVKLLDFGIARAGPRRITAMGAVLGTPEYMAPEQARGEDVDHRADLYALGVLLFEMLTGRAPFQERDLVKLIEQQLHGAPPHLSERRPELVDLVRTDEVIQSLLAKSREQRPPTAEATVTALLGAMAQDLGRATAERLQRSTLAIGSGLIEKPDAGRSLPAEPTGWKATLPAPGERPAGGRPDPALLLSGPVPTLPRTGVGARGSRGQPPSPARTVAIAAATALVAAAVTFAVASWLRDRSAVEDHTAPPTMAESSPASTDEPHGSPGATVSSRPEPSRAVMPVTPGPTATRVTSNDAAAAPSENDTDSGDAMEPQAPAPRSQGGKKRPKADGSATPTATKPPPPTPTPSTEPRASGPSPAATDPARPERSGSDRERSKSRPPADLKDPFPAN